MLPNIHFSEKTERAVFLTCKNSVGNQKSGHVRIRIIYRDFNILYKALHKLTRHNSKTTNRQTFLILVWLVLALLALFGYYKNTVNIGFWQ